jgi:hypothetical protein
MKKTILLLLVCIIGKTGLCQNADCKVMTDPLKGTYEGACEGGKANGQGKATGIDSYEGWFVNGYPEGKGMYTWKDGHYYVGQFKKGKLNGMGDMYFESAGGNDSIITGYWEKDKYKGLYEKPYIVHNTTTDIARVGVSKVSDKASNISVTVTDLRSNFGLYNNSLTTTTVMTSHTIIQGIFMNKTVNTLTNSQITTFKDVSFPFRATFYFGNSSVDIELLEPGDWAIEVPINK